MPDAEAVAKELWENTCQCWMKQRLPTSRKKVKAECVSCLSDALTTFAAQQVAQAQAKIRELQTVLDAWHSQFGTTQLTHARERLRVAEDAATSIEVKLAQARRETRIETLADASHRGYLDHRPDCRKGTTSATCTCGIMAWIPADSTPPMNQEPVTLRGRNQDHVKRDASTK